MHCIEATHSGMLALMTDYSQALQAEAELAQRPRLSVKSGDKLALLMDRPLRSLDSRQVMCGLRGRGRANGECTAKAAQDCACGASVGVAKTTRFQVPAPKRLQ